MRSITVRKLQRNFNREILDLPVVIIRKTQLKGTKQTTDILGVIYPYKGEEIDTTPQSIQENFEPPQPSTNNIYYTGPSEINLIESQIPGSLKQIPELQVKPTEPDQPTKSIFGKLFKR